MLVQPSAPSMLKAVGPERWTDFFNACDAMHAAEKSGVSGQGYVDVVKEKTGVERAYSSLNRWRNRFNVLMNRALVSEETYKLGRRALQMKNESIGNSK